METEIWKDIQGYEGLYMVSSFWRIKSLMFKDKYREKILLPASGKIRRYLSISLCKDKKITFNIHRLVAQAFLWLDIKNIKLLVCHKDDNPENNKVNNLFLWSAKDNMQDCKNKWRNTNNDKFKKRIRQLTMENILIKEWESVLSAERWTGVSSRNIPKACSGKYKQSWWFKWEYVT